MRGANTAHKRRDMPGMPIWTCDSGDARRRNRSDSHLDAKMLVEIINRNMMLLRHHTTFPNTSMLSVRCAL